jgi:RNA polymerase sigma-70 factor (ECF subfamily)
MALHLDETSLLSQFHSPSTKEKGYTGIVKKYQEKLYWHIRRMLVDHEDTNDVLQAVLIKIWNGLENFREEKLSPDIFYWQQNSRRDY